MLIACFFAVVLFFIPECVRISEEGGIVKWWESSSLIGGIIQNRAIAKVEFSLKVKKLKIVHISVLTCQNTSRVYRTL
jgi:hypothetical protein